MNELSEINVGDNGDVLFVGIVPKQSDGVVDFLAMAVRELPGVAGTFPIYPPESGSRTSGFGIVVEEDLSNRNVLTAMVLHVAKQIVNNDPLPEM